MLHLRCSLRSFYYFGFVITCSRSNPASGLDCFIEPRWPACRAAKGSCNFKFHNSARQSGWKSKFGYAQIFYFVVKLI